jgi:hypothetical protein
MMEDGSRLQQTLQISYRNKKERKKLATREAEERRLVHGTLCERARGKLVQTGLQQLRPPSVVEEGTDGVQVGRKGRSN